MNKMIRLASLVPVAFCSLTFIQAEPEPPALQIPEHTCCHNGRCCATPGCCDAKGCNSTACPAINGNQEGAEERVMLEEELIQGAWKLIALKVNGKTAPAENAEAMKLVFDGNTLAFESASGRKKFIFKLLKDCKPAGLEMIHVGKNSKGEMKEGAYELERDALRICFGINGRPAVLSAEDGTGNTMYTLERVKP